MIFKGLTRRFKYNSGQRALRSQLASAQGPVMGKGKVGSIGVIVDLEQFDEADRFQDLARDLGLAPNTVKVIGYRNARIKNSPYTTPVFTDEDLGWKGEIANGYVDEFLQREYDLLVNYYNSDHLLTQLMSTKVKARIKAGFPKVNHALNDLIIGVELSDFDTFRSELKKYLNVLNELN